MTTVHNGQHQGRRTPSESEAAANGLDRAWRGWAACRSVDPELFFPVGEDRPALAQVAEAKTVCARCPVVAACLSFALVALLQGVAGGLSAQERRALHKQRRGSGSAGVVALLMGGEWVPGASRLELAQAAVGLYLAGHRAGWVATRLGVGERRVHRWLARYRAGQPLITTRSGPRGAGES